MALTGSGQISLGDIAGEFGGDAPHALSEYYDKGNAPSSGEIQLAADFYGTSASTASTVDILNDGSCKAVYQFDNNTNDTSGNYNCTNISGVTYATGRIEQCLVLDHANDTFRFGYQLDYSSAWSVSAWLKVTSDCYSDYYLNGTDSGRILYVSNANDIPALGCEMNINNAWDAFTYNVTADVWNHYVATNEGSGDLKIYVGGELRATKTTVGVITGATAYDYHRHYYGTTNLDQVRIFNKVLSSAEVTTLYQET